MTTIINGSSPSITFSDSTTQTTAFTSTPSVTTITTSSDASINGLTVGKGYGSGTFNTALGVSVLSSGSLTGNYNTGIGYGALTSVTTGSNNTGIGNSAGGKITTGADNIAIGISALGYNAASTTGSNNVAVGDFALTFMSSGGSNTAIGHQSLFSNTTASNNTAVGYQALYNNTTASNTAFGYQALYTQSSGSSNVAMGYQAGYNLTTGNLSTLVGYSAGNSITSGVGNTMLGTLAQPSGGGGNYQLVIATNGGSNVFGKGDSTGYINPNGGGVYQGNNSSSWSTTSDQRLKKNIVDNKEGLDKITQIRVRNFEYRLPEEVTELDSQNAVAIEGIQLGVIAQELQQVLPDCIKEETTGVLRVDSDNVFWHMVNAIKDLKALVDAQATEIAELKAKVA